MTAMGFGEDIQRSSEKPEVSRITETPTSSGFLTICRPLG